MADKAESAECSFCHGRPVGNAATWVDGKPRPPAACPRCGVVNAEDAEADDAGDRYFVCENCAHTFAAPESPAACENCGAYWLVGFEDIDAAEDHSQALLDARNA